MKNNIWILGMVLIAFLVGMMFSQDTTAQEGEIGRYQIEKIDDFTNFVWKIDTAIGNIWRCELPTGAMPGIARGCGLVIR